MSIEEAYNAWSQQYDTNHNRTRDLDAMATRQMLSHQTYTSVVELGCGTGKNTDFYLARAGRVIGLDFSEHMLARAREKINDPRVSFYRADLTEEWPVEGASADLITSSLVLEHIENLGFIFRQAYKKLAAGGQFFISELHPFKQYLGSKARFETEEGVQELEVYLHHLTDYTAEAERAGFSLITVREWWDEPADTPVPRLITFIFRK